MKKFILILVLLLGISLGLFYFLFPINQDESNEEIVETSEPSKEEPVQNLLTDDQLIPYSDLPNYEISSMEIPLHNENQEIFGQCLFPEDLEEKVPLIICCHGLGADLYSCYNYAEIFAQKGIASYIFDFRGGGGTRSEGETTNMSVMTEVLDLETVLSSALTWDFVDPNKIILFGESQGGLVAAITASRHPNEVAGLILEYPAFIIEDTIKSFEVNHDELLDSYTFGDIELGKRYITDMENFDSYNEISKYNKHVLILQGNEDKIVPEEYSKKAADTYKSSEYFIINGSGHGFYGEQFEESLTYIFNYLERIGIINIKNG